MKFIILPFSALFLLCSCASRHQARTEYGYVVSVVGDLQAGDSVTVSNVNGGNYMVVDNCSTESRAVTVDEHTYYVSVCQAVIIK